MIKDSFDSRYLSVTKGISQFTYKSVILCFRYLEFLVNKLTCVQFLFYKFNLFYFTRGKIRPSSSHVVFSFLCSSNSSSLSYLPFPSCVILHLLLLFTCFPHFHLYLIIINKRRYKSYNFVQNPQYLHSNYLYLMGN